jgi:hypothetical protein
MSDGSTTLPFVIPSKWRDLQFPLYAAEKLNDELIGRLGETRYPPFPAPDR